MPEIVPMQSLYSSMQDEKKICSFDIEVISEPTTPLIHPMSRFWMVDSGEGELTFSARGGRNSALAESGKKLRPVELTSVDALLQGNRADYIKMDVEGVERETLLGCRETIARWKPQLSVAAYHRNGDLWELPLLVRELGPDYRLYLRRHKYVPAWEIILYAI